MSTQSHLKRKPKAIQIAMTPPMATRSRSSSVSSDFDESYFTRTYVPLSSLPTPPPSSHADGCSRRQASKRLFSPGEDLDPALLGPAIHLTNLIPTSTSLTSTSIPLVHAMLTRANLPLEIIALAVCILDSLNSRFALQWRKSFPLKNQHISSYSDPFSNSSEADQHIDSIHPEVIALSALILAHKFLDDAQTNAKRYADQWGKGLWSCEQINFTQRVLMENLGYRLLSLWNEDIINEAKEDMVRAGEQYAFFGAEDDNHSEEHKEDGDWDMCSYYEDNGFGVNNGMGRAIKGPADNLTPVESPMEKENVGRGSRQLGAKSREAFRKGVGVEVYEVVESVGEPFPLYVEPSLDGLGYFERF